MTRLDLPTGGWVEWRDVASITEKERRPFRKAMLRLSKAAQAAMGGEPGALIAALDPDDADVMWDMSDIVASTMIASCSFVPDDRRPTVDDVSALTGGDYEAIIDASADFGSAFVGVNFAPTAPGDRSADNPS